MVHSTHNSNSISSNLLYGLTLLLAAALPFEIIKRTFALTWIELTNLELIAYATVGVFILDLLDLHRRERLLRVLERGRSLLLPALTFIGLAALSAAFAPSHRLDAFKFVARLVTGVYVTVLVAYVADSRRRVAGISWALILGAGISACIGLGDVAGITALAPIFDLFRAAPSRVGGILRLSATFQYTTIASMFFEMVTPVALALAVTAGTRAKRITALGIALLCVSAIVLTLTRTGMVTVAVVALFLAGLSLFHSHARALRRPAILAGSTLVIVAALLAFQTTAFRTRLTTENDLNWYGAAYAVPPDLTLQAGDTTTVTVEVTNTGEIPWDPTGDTPFVLGYFWLTADGEQELDLGHQEVPLPRRVPPGETIQLTTRLAPPLPAGTYQLAWSMLQRDILWFHDRDVPAATTMVEIRPNDAAPQPTPPPTTPRDEVATVPPTVGRRTLWRAALQMFVERPLLGVGPDNFRQLYGRYLGMDEWDEGLHANNMYLELLADFGLLGAVAFGIMLLAAGRHLIATLRITTSATLAVWTAGIAGALLAFLTHGFLDYFLEFAPTYLLFWIVLGMIVALYQLARIGDANATR